MLGPAVRRQPHRADGSADLTAAEYARIGYPIGELARDGTARSGCSTAIPGVLNPTGCTLQLLYEVHDPRAYITPDAVLDFSARSSSSQIGPNRVRMSGARARAMPEQLKVVGFLARRGLIADIEIGFAGTGALEPRPQLGRDPAVAPRRPVRRGRPAHRPGRRRLDARRRLAAPRSPIRPRCGCMSRRAATTRTSRRWSRTRSTR